MRDPALLDPDIRAYLDAENAYSKAMLAGTESLRIELQRRTMLAEEQQAEIASRSLPEMPPGPVFTIPDAPSDVTLEAMAPHVPEECFYARCGSFGNFIWLRKTLERTGGDLANLIALRGANYDIAQKLERQMALKESALAEVVGPLVISDVALPGVVGLSILAGVATSPAHCSVILTNPIGGNEAHVEAMRLCAAAIFEKPLNLKQFLAGVERVLARVH